MVYIGPGAHAQTTFVIPDDDQLRQLYRVVYDKHPKMDPRRDERTRVVLENILVPNRKDPTKPTLVQQKVKQRDTTPFDIKKHDDTFSLVFGGVGRLGRLPAPEQKNPHHITWWCGELSRMLNIDVELRMFQAAVLAHGDIPWTEDGLFGLAQEGFGFASGDAWKHVIAGGAPRPPTPVYRPEYQPGRVTIDLAPGAVGHVGFIGSTFR
jgi:hypothetical protein